MDIISLNEYISLNEDIERTDTVPWNEYNFV